MRRWTGLGQIAISVSSLDETVSFYERCFGYGRNGGFDRLFNGGVTNKVLARPGVRHQLRWLSDQDPSFQLELVHFDVPPARPVRPGRRACDVGFCRMSVWVQDFDGAVARLREAGAGVLLGPPRDYGGARRVACRDPNGVVIELLERDLPPSPEPRTSPAHPLAVRTRGVSLSVPSLAEAEPLFEGVLGMRRADFTLHGPDMEELWGLGGARTKSAAFWAGDHLIELVEYVDPRGRPRPADEDYGDPGIYHVALRFDRARDVRDTHAEVTAAGHGSLSDPVSLGLACLVYLRTRDGFLLECLQFHPWIGRFIGYGKRAWR